MTDVTTRHQQHGAVIHRYRDEGDGTYSHSVSTLPRVWDTLNLVWVRQAGDSTGTTTVSSAGGGGGPATIADGADVAQGSTSDASSANTVVGILKAIKAAITGTLTTTTSWASAQHVIVDTAPTTAVTGPLTDTQLRATAVPVSGTFFQVTQPVSAASLPLPSGAATGSKQDSQTTLLGGGLPSALATDRLKVDGSGVTQPVSGTVTATGPLTDTQLRASAVPVSGTFFQGTQPVSLATNTPDVTDRSARLLGHVTVDAAPTTAVTGPLTDTQLRATAVPVSGTVTAASSAAITRDGVTQNAVVDVDVRRLLEQVLLELKFQTAVLAALAPSALPHDAQLLT